MIKHTPLRGCTLQKKGLQTACKLPALGNAARPHQLLQQHPACSTAAGSGRPCCCSSRLQCRSAATATTSTVQVLATASGSGPVKDASQPYINKYVQPLHKATLQVYKFHEDIFDQLLVTPDLDRQLNSNTSLQWATATVEAAVADAIDIAFISGSRSRSTSPAAAAAGRNRTAYGSGYSPGSSIDSASPSSSMDSYMKTIKLSDGMGAAGSGDASSSFDAGGAAALTRGSAPAPAPATAASATGTDSGCSSTNDDEQCEVDWDLCATLGDDDFEQAYDVLDSADMLGRSSSSLDAINSCADQLAAAAAVEVERTTGEAFDVAAAHTFLQRVLYKINRLNHFWYDDLTNYVNERSAWLARLRDTIEEPWQAWEQQQMAAEAALEAALAGDRPEGKTGQAGPESLLSGYQDLSLEDIKQGLKDRYAHDVDPPLSAAQQYVVDDMGPLGYCHLLAVGSVDGLVEASRQSRVCAGAANEVACAIFRVLMEEYGTGRLSRKHSTFYKKMMQELGLNTKEEAYLDLVPWQWLATANQNFLLTERRRHYLRYAGALSFFEINGPSVYKTYLAAGRRCGLNEDAAGYWALHIKEDERHGRQMLDEVALPLVDMYPSNAWELLWGYDQDRFMGARAGAALVGHIQAADTLAAQAAAAAASSGKDKRAGSIK